MEIRLEIFSDKEAPLSFLNSLKAFLKEKLEKHDVRGYSMSVTTETVYDVLFAETTDDREETTPIADRTKRSPQT